MLNDKLLNILTFEQQYLLFSNTLPIYIPEMTKSKVFKGLSILKS